MASTSPGYGITIGEAPDAAALIELTFPCTCARLRQVMFPIGKIFSA